MALRTIQRFRFVYEHCCKSQSTVLTVVALDIIRLSGTGISCTKYVLCLSRMEHFRVVFTPFDTSLAELDGHLLHSVQWAKLKTLILSGDNINEWTRLWSAPVEPRLPCFEIRETGSQDLPPSSVLWIHQLAFSSLRAKFHLENIKLQKRHDWMLLAGAVVPNILEIFSLCAIGAEQFVLITEALIYLSRFETISHDTGMPRCT